MLFTRCAEQWLVHARQSQTTLKWRRSCYQREIVPVFKDRSLKDITESDIRDLCNNVKARGAPATAIQILGMVKTVFKFAMHKGYRGENPARFIPIASIARRTVQTRVLSPDEIGLLCRLVDDAQVKDHYRLAIRLLLLTVARRGELLLARWDEIDFERAVWTVPPGRAKTTKTRQIYLSTQALDIFIQLKTLAGHSDYIFPSPLDSYTPMAPACLDVCVKALCRRAQKLNLPLRNFALTDLRSTAEDHLKQAQFDFEWVEVVMAREVNLHRLLIHDSDLHARPLRHMLQEWANMVDAWVAAVDYVPVLAPPAATAPTTPDAI